MVADVVGVGKLAKVDTRRRDADTVDELFLLLGGERGVSKRARLCSSKTLT